MSKSDSQKRVVYREFGGENASEAFERGKPEITPAQQSLRVQATRSGRKGKTVTLVTGFQVSQETLLSLLKQLKAQCGSGGTIKEQTLELQGEHKETVVKFLSGLGFQVKISGG
jgi:translation initiation factor 1